MNIGYVAPLSATGYSQAARSYIKALHLAGHTIRVELTSEDPSQEFGDEGRLMRELALNPMDLEDCDVVIHHREPGHCNWTKGVPNVCYTVWEADNIPKRWTWVLNDEAVEVWVPSQFNVEAFERSGVVKPVIKVPHVVDPEMFAGEWEPKHFEPDDLKGRKFLFYMGPWDSRKNPQDLLRAYYKAFSYEDNIILVMRSYGGMHAIDSPAPSVQSIRDEFHDKNLPPVLFLGTNLPEQDINWLHKNALLFVSLAHSEGWGLGHSQSLAMEVPVLSVDWGGSLEFQNHDNSFLVRVAGLIPTAGFPAGTMYDANTMRWALGDINHAVELLREAYNNPILCADKGLKGKQYVVDNFNYKAIGDIMTDRLNVITKSVGTNAIIKETSCEKE